MGFWIFCVLFSLLIPLMMLFIGNRFIKHEPQKINMIYGYRTSMSMKNNDTWEFAHRHCGRIWKWIGIVMLPLSVIPLLFVIGKSEDIVGRIFTIIETLQTIVIIISIFPTEIALRKNFDSDGNPIK